MPGLVGIVRKNIEGSLDCGLFQRMLAALWHRPWYEVDEYFVPEVAVARLHLGIINPTPQPFISEDGCVKVFLYGEIYNDEVSETNQLEFIARAYERFGRDFAAQLNGSFVVLLIDEAADSVVIATDRTASKPLFYYFDGSCLYFAPEPKALMLVPSLPKHLNLSAVASFLACGFFVNGEPLLEDVRLLDNATVLTVSPAGVTTHKYWRYIFNEEVKDRGAAHYQHALAELIRQAVRRRMRSQHRYGILLSGGYDSRGILGCCLAENHRQSVTTISWGVAEDIPYSDCAIAKRLAGKLGLSHTFYPLRIARLPQHFRDFVYLHDGLTDVCSNYPESLNIFSQIRTELGVQVILRGDECFGYSRPACDERTIFDKFSILPLDRSRHYKKILKKHWLSNFSELINKMITSLSSKSNATDVYLRQNFFYFDQRVKHYINPLNYLKSMEVEVRTPYLDNQILDFLTQLPAKYHFGKRFYRRVILKMFPNLFEQMAKHDNIPNLALEFKSTSLAEFTLQTLSIRDSEITAFFDMDIFLGLLPEFFSTKIPEEDNRFVKALSKPLKSSPIIYKNSYKIYNLIKNNQESNVIPLSVIILRILTLKVYMESLREKCS
jgi:asparagine synthetase B (glutamine-hydrolysing)